MTEMDNGVQSSSNFAPAPVSSPTPAPSAPVESERTFRQSEVNDLVGRAKSEAIERYKRDSSMASHTNQSSPQAPSYRGESYQPPYQAPNTPQHVSQDDVRRLAAEETQRLRQEWIQESHRNAQEQDAQRIASEFYSKVGIGEGGMAAFEKSIGEAGIDLRSIPYHVQLANMVDNTRDVMLELASNPTKIGQLQSLIDIDLRQGRSPTLAMAEMKRLSQSIKDNATAKNFRAPNEPLSPLRPSNAGTGVGGALTTADYKRKYKV